MAAALALALLLATCSPLQPRSGVVAGPLVYSNGGVGPSAAQQHREEHIIAKIHEIEGQIEELKKRIGGR